MWQCSSPIWCTSSVQSLMFHTSVFYKRISCIMYFVFCILFVFCMLYFVLCVFFVSFVFCTFGADPQCNASCSVPLCFTRRSPGENAALHPAREITASALDHSMMSRCQAYCWKGDVCTVIFERYYGKYSPSAIISQSVKQKYKKCTEIKWQFSSLHMICFRSHYLRESVVIVKRSKSKLFFGVPGIKQLSKLGENINE